ncbi:MAG: hypothetical protein HC875_19990 [Anaerolineales bacterium]|nr:hypothetical protein [Anaerolineales bacterium]
MYKSLSRKTIEAAMQEVANTPQDDAGYLTDQMLEEQPVILEYLYRLDGLPFGFDQTIRFSEAEREYILYIGIVVWKALKESPRPMHSVTWEELDKVVADFENFANDLVRQGHTEIPGAALLMIENHPEPELLRFITDAIRPRADDPKFPPIRPEYRSAAMTVFQIILTAMVGNGEG